MREEEVQNEWMEQKGNQEGNWDSCSPIINQFIKINMNDYNNEGRWLQSLITLHSLPQHLKFFPLLLGQYKVLCFREHSLLLSSINHPLHFFFSFLQGFDELSLNGAITLRIEIITRAGGEWKRTIKLFRDIRKIRTQSWKIVAKPNC